MHLLSFCLCINCVSSKFFFYNLSATTALCLSIRHAQLCKAPYPPSTLPFFPLSGASAACCLLNLHFFFHLAPSATWTHIRKSPSPSCDAYWPWCHACVCCKLSCIWLHAVSPRMTPLPLFFFNNVSPAYTHGCFARKPLAKACRSAQQAFVHGEICDVRAINCCTR